MKGPGSAVTQPTSPLPRPSSPLPYPSDSLRGSPSSTGTKARGRQNSKQVTQFLASPYKTSSPRRVPEFRSQLKE